METPIENSIFEIQKITAIRNELFEILTPQSVEMIVNYQLDPNRFERPIQPELNNRLIF